MTDPAATGWWSAVDPVTVEITCGDERHRLSWRRGKLVLEDHDIGAEESFAALGGEPALCLEVLRAWRAGVDDRQVLWFWDAAPSGDRDLGGMVASMRARHQQLLARRTMPPGAVHVRASRPLPPPGPRSPAPAAAASGWAQSGPPGPVVPQVVLDRMRADMATEYRRSLLSALPEELRLRLGLAAIVRAERRQGDRAWFGTRSADVEAALAGRARPAFEACMRAWRGRVGERRLMVDCWLAGTREAAAASGLMDDAGAWAAVRLPLRWLVDVWARGVALVDGCFVLEIHAADGPGTRLEVTALRWERRLPAGSTPVAEPAIAVRTGSGWRLRWAD